VGVLVEARDYGRPTVVDRIERLGKACPECGWPTLGVTIFKTMKDVSDRKYALCPNPGCPRKLVSLKA
jgi:hypothetical protein